MTRRLPGGLIPDASQEAIDILDPQRGQLDAPIRSEIFGAARFEQHAKSLAATHESRTRPSSAKAFAPRLAENVRTLREARYYIGIQASTGLHVSPAAEWLLDNFHLIEAQLKEIHDGLPSAYFRDLPVLIDAHLAGLPRVYGVAWAFVAHTDSAFNEDLLALFLDAYQEVRELTLGELWALPTTLRVVLIENLRRLAERVATAKAAREFANLCCDRVETFSSADLNNMLAAMEERGVGQAFLLQMSQRLYDHRTSDAGVLAAWLASVLPDRALAQSQQQAEQASDNVSVSNAIGALRLLGDTDWRALIGHTSKLMRSMSESAAFRAERDDTQDDTLHAIERLARRTGQAETTVSKKLLELMHRSTDPESIDTVPGYWLNGPGSAALHASLGSHGVWHLGARIALRRLALPGYLAAIAIGSFAFATAMLVHPSRPALFMDLPEWTRWLAGFMLLFPASEAVVAVVNRLISESARPARLPRLALASGIPAEHRVMVAIPAMLGSELGAAELTYRLELHYLANPERHAQFALLTDWTDSPTEHRSDDAERLSSMQRRIQALNDRYPAASGDPTRFLLLHRMRRFSKSEQAWIGWERKRGKLEQLIDLLADSNSSSDTEVRRSPFVDLGPLSAIAPATPYVVTLDSDTQLPPARLRELVGVAAHPHNLPRLDASCKRVIGGYGILQPRIVTPLPSTDEVTRFHWLFAGQGGIDPYSAASSEVYQDVFGEGTFSGKGLLHVQALHRVLSGRLPEGRVLSHDLLEGSIARCAGVSDVTLIEDAPVHADVAASRVHRWTRGDWQLLPLLAQPGKYDIRPINRWKMTDNLRRSLVAPMSLAALMLAFASGVVSPWAALGMIAAAFCAGPLLGALAGLAPSRDELALRYFYRQAVVDILRAVCLGAWGIVQLLAQAMLLVDAVARALYRTFASHRLMLQWTTAAAVQASAGTDLTSIARKHFGVTIVAICLLIAAHLVPLASQPLAVVLCLIWAVSPVTTWWVSRPRTPNSGDAISDADGYYLRGVARDTWRLFERWGTAEDNHLPPDNLQTFPHAMTAHRTSPTNIGLYLLCIATAREFGWIGTVEMLDRIEATLSTMASLERYRGHFLNWYDTQTLRPLPPAYVSAVDSGNLCGHLLAVGRACLERESAPLSDTAGRIALAASIDRLAPHRKLLESLAPASMILALVRLADALETMQQDVAAFHAMLDVAQTDLDDLRSDADEPYVASTREATRPIDTLGLLLHDHLTTLRSLALDVAHASDAANLRARLRTVATTCHRLGWEAEFGFLFDARRQLLHIGFRVAEQQLDTSYYDLLASESRLTSLLAIAKGDIPVSHWTALGRPFYAIGTEVALRSWSGSMFEYLMPTLTLAEPRGSVLYSATRAAVVEQIDFGRLHGVPWGISESAYAASDHTLAYQYAPQGVPRLALRRTPADELVIAPYATALAVQVAPGRATDNLRRMEAMGARDARGFVEALDFSPERRSGEEGHVRVSTFMAHHQGMSIVAIANVLLDAAPRRWGMAEPRLQAVESLLHERAPREVSALLTPPPGRAADRSSLGSGLRQDIAPGAAGLQPTHLLSNGRYTVSLRANGAGWSQFNGSHVSRWRDDALRDAHGTFFYLRRPGASPVSITHHPAPSSDAEYDSTYHADRVCLDARWPDLHSRCTVWVSPEDDVELRQIELRNLSALPIELELMSYFEVSLADARADEAHPAFANLFVRAAWDATTRALYLERKPRLATEGGVHAVHFIANLDKSASDVRVQTDRLRWLGRNHGTSHPLANFASPSAGDVEQVTGLDPVASISVRVRIAPYAKISLTFATAASSSPDVLPALVDQYSQTINIERSSLMSATLTGIRLREMRIKADSFAAIQMLSTPLALLLTRETAASSGNVDAVCDRRLLWRFGISGDRPLLLVSAGVMQGLGLLRSLVHALRLWSWSGLPCDLVVVNSEPASYLMPLRRELLGLKDRYATESSASSNASRVAGFHLLLATELTPDEWSTLRAMARVRLNADGRSLPHHVAELVEWHDRSLDERQATSVVALSPSPVLPGGSTLREGRFSKNGGCFSFDVSGSVRPARPWVNVLSNPDFGAQISESGAGYTWARNSRLNQLTPWSNDPVSDPSGEWFVIQDMRTSQLWNVGAAGLGGHAGTYHVVHGQGHTSIEQKQGDLSVTTSWRVDVDSSIKEIRIVLVNRSHRAMKLRAVGMVEWVMGGGRTDRISTRSACERIEREGSRPSSVVFCTQTERMAGFGGGTAFLACTSTLEETSGAHGWTADRREFFDSRGRFVLPDDLAERSGSGLDPCAGLATRCSLDAGASAEIVFLLGYADSPTTARVLARDALRVSPESRRIAIERQWDRLLGATTVETPDPLFDAMVNRWLLYQTVACRLWSRAGFYQAGGAFGFRDQLQDAMALAVCAPDTLRRQIVLNASRQFPEGDVQHWWHAPNGAGVRTHFSDDLLWLVYASVHYMRVTGDHTLLDESVAFLEGPGIPPGAEDAYYAPSISEQSASVYEHCARTIDRSLATGAHGLPLMGTGDWNDGMNRVGHEGRGESVWVAWFLCRIVADFAPVARTRHDDHRAARWEQAAAGWQRALHDEAWDGDWFMRAFFDDGTPLGSSGNAECRIDLIAQSWSVLSGVSTNDHRSRAMAAVESHLVDRTTGLVRLLDPPLARQDPSAGYIQAYPPGVRENGGQYSHAAVWALMAHAELGQAEAAWRAFTYLSPAHRSRNPAQAAVYALEPYVMAGDIYSEAPYAGRGGWSWYTGSAAWMHRAAIESICGLTVQGNSARVRPCMPPHWSHLKVQSRRNDGVHDFIVCRENALATLDHAWKHGATALGVGEAVELTGSVSRHLVVIPTDRSLDQKAPSDSADATDITAAG